MLKPCTKTRQSVKLKDSLRGSHLKMQRNQVICSLSLQITESRWQNTEFVRSIAILFEELQPFLFKILKKKLMSINAGMTAGRKLKKSVLTTSHSPRANNFGAKSHPNCITNKISKCFSRIRCHAKRSRASNTISRCVNVCERGLLGCWIVGEISKSVGFYAFFFHFS